MYDQLLAVLSAYVHRAGGPNLHPAAADQRAELVRHHVRQRLGDPGRLPNLRHMVVVLRKC